MRMTGLPPIWPELRYSSLPLRVPGYKLCHQSYQKQWDVRVILS